MNEGGSIANSKLNVVSSEKDLGVCMGNIYIDIII